MKYLNYVLSTGLSIGSVVVMFKMNTTQDVLLFLLLIISGILFLTFALLDERNEEIDRLRYQMRQLLKSIE